MGLLFVLIYIFNYVKRVIFYMNSSLFVQDKEVNIYNIGYFKNSKCVSLECLILICIINICIVYDA